MKILIVGGGGREHALALSLSRSPRVSSVIVAPGNGGTDGGSAAPIRNLDRAAGDRAGLLDFVRRNRVALTVVGPEGPLAEGIVDEFAEAGEPVFGPSRAAARLEANKAWAKAFMLRHGIPTARAATFTDHARAMEYLETAGCDLVVKAAGLAAGKGVIVPETPSEARAALDRIMKQRAFGDAGSEVVLEERLQGQEVSVLAFTDGRNLCIMPPAQDHKPVMDGDRGPNTGGMGAYAPAPLMTPGLLDQVRRQVLEPAVRGLREEGHPYVGVLYAGLMVQENRFDVLEFNCRFGDPETQVILPLLESDLLEILEACVRGELDRVRPAWSSGAAATVVAASEGYPGSYPKGREITGIEQASSMEKVMVFHAGTHRKGASWVTSGGRVLAVTGQGMDLPGAIRRAYEGLRQIGFDGMHFRSDIGSKAL